MKKLRFQPTFASLTEAELEQLSEAVQRETYDAVRERICRPRSEGGLDLHFTSNSPLVRLHDKKNRLDLVNARLCAQCSENKKLTLTELNTFISLEKRAPEEVHDAILGVTYDLVTERDNTPHQLLALQRLADFPARSALRAQMAELRSSKEQRAEAKAQREAEMHIHKISLDLRKFEHKLEMDTFHKQITTQRLTLRLSPTPNLDRNPNILTADYDDQNYTSQPAPFTEDNSDRPRIRILVDEDGKPYTRFPTPNPLPHDIYLKNCAYTKKLLAGLVDPVTGEALEAPPADPTPNPTQLETGNLKLETPFQIISPRPLPPEVIAANLLYAEKVRTGKIIIDRSGPYIRAVELPDTTENIAASECAEPAETESRASENLSTLNSCVQSTQAPTRTDLLSTSGNPSAADLASTVDTYTVNRAREHVAYEQKHTPWPHRHSPPPYITEFHHCPCGHACPCPIHEAAAFGPFPEIFWKLSPFSRDYAAFLEERNLPYRLPKEYLA